jgi:hypothetical protein
MKTVAHYKLHDLITPKERTKPEWPLWFDVIWWVAFLTFVGAAGWVLWASARGIV